MMRYFAFLVLVQGLLQVSCKKEEIYSDLCEVTSIIYGYHTPNVYYIEVGHSVQYECEEGYELEGHAVLNCLPNSFDHEPPVCRDMKSTVTCERQIDVLDNGVINQPPGNDPLGVGQRIWYTCNDYYRLEGAQDVTCLSSGDWSNPPPHCVPVLIPCNLRDPPQYGSHNPIKETYTFGDKLYYRCDDGFQLIGDDFAVCTAHGTWNYPVPTCQALTCRDLVAPENGFFNPVASSYPIGSQARFGCNRNYRLDGAKILTCQDDQQWSNEEPTCVRVGCLPLQAPENGYLRPERDLYDFGSGIVFKCEDNYDLIGNRKVVCLKNSQFSGPVPTCQLQQCSVPSINNGRVEDEQNEYFVGDSASFVCDNGFQLIGAQTVQCQGRDRWSEAFPQCVPIQCRRPDFPNGFLDPDRDYYNVQETAVFECNAGYTLNGVTEAECVDNDVWSEDIPTCEPNQCSRPYIDNGRVEQDGDQFDVNALVSFVCDEGYSLQGQQRLYCLESGQWSDDFPSCVANQCNRPILDNGSFEEDKTYYGVGETVNFICDQGFILEGDVSVTCQSNSRWSNDFPICNPVQCSRPNIDYGILDEDQQYYYVDQPVYFSCVDGFQLEGVEQAVCQPNGEWSEDIPQCVEITCQRPDIDNVLITPDNSEYNYQDTIVIQCISGYVISGTSDLQCVGQNEWSDEFPSCQAVQCEKPDFDGDLIEDKPYYDVGEIISFVCADGFQLKGSAELICNDNGQLSGEIPHCKRRRCERPSIRNGEFREVQRAYFAGDTVEFQCFEHFYLDGVNEITCQDNGEWDNDFPTCVEYTCEVQSAPANGGVNPSQGPFVYQSTANFYCDEGYTLVGFETITCLREGHWSNGAPTCVANTCEEPTIDNGSFFDQQDVYGVGAEVNFECDDGYTLVGMAQLQCQSAGMWSYVFPTCQAVYCEQPQLSNGVSVHPNQNSYSVGQTITYQCTRGTSLDGAEEAECLSNGQFSEPSPTCTANACVRPSIEYGSFTPSKDSYAVGNKVKFQCDDGFSLQGARVIRCSYTSEWSADFPICEPVTCLVPSIEYGVFEPVQPQYSYRDEVTFTCNEGFSLSGRKSIRCLASGRWSEDFPTCQGNQCSRPVRNSNIASILPSRTSYNVGVSVTFRCRRGFILVGSETSECQSDQSWSPQEPTCERDVVCKVRTRPRYTVFTPRRYAYQAGQVVVVSCRRNYKLKGESKITCLSSGKFSAAFPTCIRPARKCRRPYATSKTIITPDQKSYSNGDEITFSCIKYYSIKKETNTAKCVNGRWTNVVPSCTPKKITSCKGRCHGKFRPNACSCSSSCKYGGLRFCCADYKQHCS